MNSILERIHQVIASFVHKIDFKKTLDEDDPWSGTLAATYFDVQIMYHNRLQATLGYMVFGCDMLLNAPFIAYWESIVLRKQKIIDKINKL